MQSAMDLPVGMSISEELITNANNDSENRWDNVFILCAVYMPNDTITAAKQPPKPTSVYKHQVGSDGVILINIPVRTLGNDQVQLIPVSFTTS